MQPKPLPLIDRQVVDGHKAADVDSWLTLLGVSAVVLAQRCRRFSWAGLQLPLFVQPFEFALGGAARAWSLSPF